MMTKEECITASLSLLTQDIALAGREELKGKTENDDPSRHTSHATRSQSLHLRMVQKDVLRLVASAYVLLVELHEEG